VAKKVLEVRGADQSMEYQRAGCLGDLGAVLPEAVTISAFILSETSLDQRFRCN